MKEWIWSDLHLGHTNIIDYCGRPFTNTNTMDATILRNWRETVKGDDIIWNLGDVRMSATHSWEDLKTIIANLPGRKMLIMGNHDMGKSAKAWRELGFDEVYPYPIIYKKFAILSHEHVFINKAMPYVNIHGHLHEKIVGAPGYVNVSVEQIGYKPVLLEEILDRYNEEKYKEE